MRGTDISSGHHRKRDRHHYFVCDCLYVVFWEILCSLSDTSKYYSGTGFYLDERQKKNLFDCIFYFLPPIRSVIVISFSYVLLVGFIAWCNCCVFLFKRWLYYETASKGYTLNMMFWKCKQGSYHTDISSLITLKGHFKWS